MCCIGCSAIYCTAYKLIGSVRCLAKATNCLYEGDFSTLLIAVEDSEEKFTCSNRADLLKQDVTRLLKDGIIDRYIQGTA